MTDDAQLEQAAELFKALSTVSRLRILTSLAGGEGSVGSLVQSTGLSQPLVSQHLRVLRSMNLVTVSRSGREAIYALTDEHDVVQVALAAVKLAHEASGGVASDEEDIPAAAAPVERKERGRADRPARSGPSSGRDAGGRGAGGCPRRLRPRRPRARWLPAR